MVGETIIDDDVVKVNKLPPQLPVYQYQFAPVPKLPLFKFSVDDEPEQIDEGEAEIEEGRTESEFTVIYNVETGPSPQAFVAKTEIHPLAPTDVYVIELVRLVPTQPEGADQV